MGLLSDGGVHSHITHIFAILEMAKRSEQGLRPLLLTGVTCPPPPAGTLWRSFAAKCAELGVGADRHRDGTLLRHGPG